MSQFSPAELLSQLKALSSGLPSLLVEKPHLRSQLYHATREAMRALEDAPDPITRVAVAQVCLHQSYPSICIASKMITSRESEILRPGKAIAR